LAELGPSTAFSPVLDDPVRNHDTAERVLLVTGKLYYDLVEERARREMTERVAIVRIEEIAPFPFEAVSAVLRRYKCYEENKGARGEVVKWVQEEPRNQGVYGHAGPRLRTVLGEEVGYWGRREEAVPAPGAGKLYRAEQMRVIQGVFEGL
jgi:probable 2-oxoglutarate dehydrogenase E1 component DHKTD1